MTETFSDLNQLGLTTGTYNALRRGGFYTCAQLMYAGRAEVRRVRWIGPGAEQEISNRLLAVLGREWTEQGAPLPALPPDAALMVQILGLGDSFAIRQGLAKALRKAPVTPTPLLTEIIEALEHGAK